MTQESEGKRDLKENGEILGTRGDCQSFGNGGVRLWEVFVDGFRLEVCEKCLSRYREISGRDKNRKEVNLEPLTGQWSQKEVREKAKKKDERSGQENIETIRSLMNCSKKPPEEIKKLRTSLERIEKAQRKLDNILGGEWPAKPGVFFPQRELRRDFSEGIKTVPMEESSRRI